MIIYDVETVRAIPDRRNPQHEDIQYCGGWEDFQGMGISCLCAWDYADETPRVFLQDNLQEFAALVEKTDCVVGFNNHRFDDRLIEAHGVKIPAAKSYDLLKQVWRGAGLSDQFDFKTHAGYSLEKIAYANFRRKKSGEGALAPIDWQRGRLGSVIDYCMTDVALTRKLLDRVIRCGYLYCPKTGGKIYVKRP
jgi:hypothetical protein